MENIYESMFCQRFQLNVSSNPHGMKNLLSSKFAAAGLSSTKYVAVVDPNIDSAELDGTFEY